MSRRSPGVPGWLKRRKTLASVVAIAVLAGVPLTVAAFHKGFPVSNVNLNAEDVWVTNGTQLLAGRLNHQIDELDASVNGSSSSLDVLQDGGAYFLADSERGLVQRVDPAYVRLTDQITVPQKSWVGYGGNTMAILAPDGRLWVIDAADRLDFDTTKTKVVAKLGTGAVAVVSKSGRTFAVSPRQDRIVSVTDPGATASVTKLAVTTNAHVTAVGNTPVVLDKGGRRLRTPTRSLDLPQTGLQLQQPSAKDASVLVSADDELESVPLDGGAATEVKAGGTTPKATSSGDVSAPVRLGDCDYAAWASSARYLYACDGAKPVGVNINQPVSGADLRFRVNHGVIALNNLQNGDTWIVSSSLKLMKDWSTVQPSKVKQKKSNKGKEQPVKASYQSAVANRTKVNHRPQAHDDNFGVRPGRATILPVLDNDQDEDGDVLTVASITPAQLDPKVGRLDVVDGGRALQFTPATGLSGTVPFRYTVTDGRGLDDDAEVRVAVRQPSQEQPPAQQRDSTVTVEAGNSVSYNVLQDWRDPDGDSIYLSAASPTTQDDVSFNPDGEITFTNVSGQTGDKIVNFQVSDGTKQTQGQLKVTVSKKGALHPIAVPDFATVNLGQPTVIKPLANDQSASGDPLELVDATSPDSSLELALHTEQGTLTATGGVTGTYYATYKITAGTRSTRGIIRIDVVASQRNTKAPLAVNDVAYVHPGQTASVTPLDNDVSPSGRVLAVQEVTGGADASALNVQLLDNTVVKITSPGVLQKQVQLSYVVSDGQKSASGTITVVPVARLVNYQPPVAVNDAVNVRAGDIATVDVLDNDYSPDDQPFSLDPTLRSTAHAKGATAFVSGSTVRFQAPRTAGSYSVEYQIADEHGQHDQATVIFTVLPVSGGNTAPDPQTITARTFAGSTVPITIPLNGIDPDGDSVFFDSITDDPQLGKVSGENATGFVYQAAGSSSGTDEFHYRVEDALGKTAVGLIRVAVIQRPTQLQPPTAVNDKVEVRPGKTASVAVLGNDSDPNGYPLVLQSKLSNVDDGLTDVSTDGSSVLFTAPQREGGYTLRYTISNEHGGTDSAYVQILVSKDAKPRYPTAEDHYVAASKAKANTVVAVDALDGATNPSGLVADLTVATTGSNAGLAKARDDGSVDVRRQTTRTVIAYQVTDPATKLTGKAFIVVPPAKIRTVKPSQQPTHPTASASATTHPPKKVTAPPHLKAGLSKQTVEMNGTRTWTFRQILDVPSGRPASLSGTPKADHGTVHGSGSSFTFTPAKDYRGPVTIRFTVNDGKEQGESSDRLTPLALSVTVGAADQSDVPQTFTPPSIRMEPGAAPVVVDLRQASYHPNSKILSALSYAKLKKSNIGGITAKLTGSTLSVSAPVTQKPNSTATFEFQVVGPKYTIEGKVNVTVTSSTKPLAYQKNPPQKLEMKRGTSVTQSNAVGGTYWYDPFSTPLTITSAKLSSAPKGVSVTHTGNTITVTSDSGAGVGDVNVDYHVADATKDPSRTAQVVGQLQVTIHDRPAQPNAPTNVAADNGKGSMTISAPASNGKAITGYEVESNHGGTWNFDKAGTVSLSGLANGTSYQFRVKATNADGDSDWSAWSTAVTPYGTPAAPSSVQIHGDNGLQTPSHITMTWAAVTNTGGGAIHYQIAFDKYYTTTGTTYDGGERTAGNKKTAYSFHVRTVSDATGRTSAWIKSNTIYVTPKPTEKVTLSNGASASAESGCNSHACHYYKVSISGFAQGDHTLLLYCNSDTTDWAAKTITAKSNGKGTWESGAGGTFCGFTGHATVDGKASNTLNMK